LDYEVDLELARQGAAIILAGDLDRIDFDADYWAFVLVGEVLWNRDHTDEAVMLCYAWLVLVSADKHVADLSRFQSKARDVRALRQLARALYRDHDPGSWHAITAAHRILSDEAGGWQQLSKLAATSPFDGLGELYSELLGIAMPDARRRPATENPMADLFLRDAVAVTRQIPIGSRDHSKYHALVAMTLQFVCAQGNPERDSELVNLLWQLDRTTRPRNARGALTRFVVSATIAEYFGDLEAARTYRRRTDQDLERARMERHRRVLASQYPVR